MFNELNELIRKIANVFTIVAIISKKRLKLFARSIRLSLSQHSTLDSSVSFIASLQCISQIQEGSVSSNLIHFLE